jgi:ABC-type transport system involved in multi-copper enzyme maturation permease subunit
MRTISWLSPFRYYPALSIVAGEAVPWINLAILLGASAMLCAIAYVRFARRDL